MKLLSAIVQMVGVLLSFVVTAGLLGASQADAAFVGGLVVSGALSLGKKLLGKAARKEVGRIAARGGALSGPVRTALPPMAGAGVGGGLLGAGGKILRTAGGLAAGGAAAAGVDRLLNGGQRKKYRRMQVTNTKALNRALRRVEGFEKLVKRTFAISGTIKPKKRRSCR